MQGVVGASMSFLLLFVGGIVFSSGLVINAAERYSIAFEEAEVRVDEAKVDLMKVARPVSPERDRRPGAEVFTASILEVHNRRAEEVGEKEWENQVKPRFLFRLWQSAWREERASSLQGVLDWAKKNPGKTIDLLSPEEE